MDYLLGSNGTVTELLASNRERSVWMKGSLGASSWKLAGVSHASIHFQSADVPGTHPAAANLLGRAWMCAAATARRRSGRGDDGAGNFSACARAQTVQGGVRAALAAPGGRALWREPEPAVQAHAAAGD